MEKAIIKTIAYFDLLDYPLTAVEVWRWLYRPPLTKGQLPSLEQVAEALEHDEKITAIISRAEGFYFMRGREGVVPKRKRRNLDVDRQMRKAVRFAKLFAFFPSVRMVAIASSLTWGNVKEGSDIDFFIVCRPEEIWVTRFLLVSMLKLFRQRPRQGATRDKICLSYYVTTEALDLSLAQAGGDDIVFAHFVAGFMPLYDPDGQYQKFVDVNRWYHHLLPNSAWPNATVLQFAGGRGLKLWQAIFTTISWPFFNRFTRDWYGRLQLRIMPERLKSLANVDTRVIVTDHTLKFHDKDNRIELRRQWQEKVKHIFDNHDLS